jgi:hypothetical protein
MDDDETTTTANHWQIRDFPNVLRHQITARAQAERKTVGEIVARCVAFAASHDWGTTTPVNQSVKPVKQHGLREVAEVACMLSDKAIPGAKGVTRSALRYLREELAPAAAPGAGGQRLLEPPRRGNGQAAVVASDQKPQQTVPIDIEQPEHGL